MGFPQFTLMPDQYVWADFRIGVPGRPNDWVAKLYGHEKQFRPTHEERFDDDHYAQHYERKDLRAVCLVRWRNPDLLEIRVPHTESRRDRERRLVLVWNFCQRALSMDMVRPWCLREVRLTLLRDAERRKAVYELGDRQFIDPESCRTTIAMSAAEDAPALGDATRKANQAYIASDDCNCQRLIVWWQPNKENLLKHALRVLVGTITASHEVVFFAQTSSRAVEYVTNELRRLEG